MGRDLYESDLEGAPINNYGPHGGKIQAPRAVLWALASLLAFFGVVSFSIRISELDDALKKMEGPKAETVVPILVNGKIYTYGELRESIKSEPWFVLSTNIFLALAIFGLGFWSRHSPLTAIVAAMTVYALAAVANAVAKHSITGHGIFLTIIVIGALLYGLQAALNQRKLAR